MLIAIQGLRNQPAGGSKLLAPQQLLGTLSSSEWGGLQCNVAMALLHNGRLV